MVKQKKIQLKVFFLVIWGYNIASIHLQKKELLSENLQIIALIVFVKPWDQLFINTIIYIHIILKKLSKAARSFYG